MKMSFVLGQTRWVGLYSASSLKQQSVGRYICRFTRTHYSDSDPTSLCSFSFMLRAMRRSNKYQFYSIWNSYRKLNSLIVIIVQTFDTPTTESPCFHSVLLNISRYCIKLVCWICRHPCISFSHCFVILFSSPYLSFKR